MSIHVNSLATLNVTVATDSTKLPLTGGTMSGPIQNIVSNTPTELLGNVRVGGTLLLDYGNAFGITGTNTLLSETELRVSTSESTDYVSLTTAGLRFADGTLQTTAGVDFNGGIITGDLELYKLYEGDEVVSPILKVTTENTYDPQNDSYRKNYSEISSGNVFLTGDGFYGPFEAQMHSYWGFRHQTIDGQTIYVMGHGITFPDGSLQTTAGIPEAPIDGNAYVRKDGEWVNINNL